MIDDFIGRFPPEYAKYRFTTVDLPKFNPAIKNPIELKSKFNTDNLMSIYNPQQKYDPPKSCYTCELPKNNKNIQNSTSFHPSSPLNPHDSQNTNPTTFSPLTPSPPQFLQPSPPQIPTDNNLQLLNAYNNNTTNSTIFNTTFSSLNPSPPQFLQFSDNAQLPNSHNSQTTNSTTPNSTFPPLNPSPQFLNPPFDTNTSHHSFSPLTPSPPFTPQFLQPSSPLPASLHSSSPNTSFTSSPSYSPHSFLPSPTLVISSSHPSPSPLSQSPPPSLSPPSPENLHNLVNSSEFDAFCDVLFSGITSHDNNYL